MKFLTALVEVTEPWSQADVEGAAESAFLLFQVNMLPFSYTLYPCDRSYRQSAVADF